MNAVNVILLVLLVAAILGVIDWLIDKRGE